MKRIVVGVDGSEAGLQAFRFALEEARLRGCTLEAVSAWHVPVNVYGGGWVIAPIDIEFWVRAAHKALDDAIAAAPDAGVDVTPVVREGHPANVLVAQSRDAELLVVGSRGLGGFRGLVLGSVSQHCVQHAACPVVVVPPPERLRAAEPEEMNTAAADFEPREVQV